MKVKLLVITVAAMFLASISFAEEKKEATTTPEKPAVAAKVVKGTVPAVKPAVKAVTPAKAIVPAKAAIPAKAVVVVPLKGAVAAPAAVKTDAGTTKTEAAVVPPTPPGTDVKAPQTVDEAVSGVKDVIGAVKAKRWWFASGLGIFIVMFILNFTGLFKKIGTRWAWITVSVASLAVGLFFAIDKTGFNWSAFITYFTAGPTIAFIRDFVKDAIQQKPASATVAATEKVNV
jgi:hypothetical protein